MSINDLEQYIESNNNKIIAIDGPSGSGKSTLAKLLSKKYNCLVFHTDDYFLHPSKKTAERLSEPGGNLDYERLNEEIFKNLKNEFIQSNHFNCMSNELEIKEPYKKTSIIIVEGVYSMHPVFNGYYDLTVFLDIDKETQYKRILGRSGAVMLERFKTEWIPLEDKYFQYYNLRKDVDLLIKIN